MQFHIAPLKFSYEDYEYTKTNLKFRTSIEIFVTPNYQLAEIPNMQETRISKFQIL